MLAKYYIAIPILAFMACNSSNNELRTVDIDKIEFKLNMQFDSSLNHAESAVTKNNNSLTMLAKDKTDFFIEPGGAYEKSDAPVLLKRIDNTKPFTVIAELNPEHRVQYDAGMLFIFVDSKRWFKFAFEADERMNTRVVTVRTDGTSDDNNHDIVKDSIIFLKISSDTKSIGFYYSTNGEIWNLVRVFKNDYPQKLYVGIGTQSPAGSGNKTVFYGFDIRDSAVKDFRSGQ